MRRRLRPPRWPRLRPSRGAWVARMPKILHCPTRIDMAAEDYHALRMDQNFDAFCAVRTKSKFSLQARSSEELKGHTIEHMECLLAYEENPIPAALRNALGAPLSALPGHRTCHTHTASAFRYGRHQRLCLQVQVQMARFYGQSDLLAPLPWFPGPRLAVQSPRAALLLWLAGRRLQPRAAPTTHSYTEASPPQPAPSLTLTNPH